MKRAATGLVALALLTLGSVASADPLANGSGIYGESNGQGLLGAPNGRSGAMNYVIPIELPPARGETQPALSLVYDSSAGDGEAGYGWGLSVPSIVRRALSGPQGNGTRFEFGGRPLVRICTNGGACGAESFPAYFTGTAGAQYYRLQADDEYRRFFYDPANERWTIQSKDGTRAELGHPTGASSGGTDVDLTTHVVYRWHLSRTFDRAGNFVAYKWAQSSRSGRSYLTDVWDTPPPATKTVTTSTTPTFLHHTQITWTPTTAFHFRRAFVENAPPDQVISQITVASRAAAATAPRSLVRQYRFSYLRSPSYSNIVGTPRPVFAPYASHSFLGSVTLYGDCHEPELAGELAPTSLCSAQPPVEFQYSPSEVFRHDAYQPTVNGARLSIIAGNAGILDVDRDGYPDLVEAYNIHGTAAPLGSVWINQGSTGLPAAKFATKTADGSAIQAASPGWFFDQGSGSQTLVGAWADASFVWINSGHPTLFPTLGCTKPSGVSGCDAWAWAASRSSGTGPVNTPAGWLLGSNADGLQSPGSARGWQWVADVDGDGLLDGFARPATAATKLGRFASSALYYSSKAGTGATQRGLAPFQSGAPLFDSAGTNSVAPSPLARTTDRFAYEDVTGDGIVDLIWMDASGSGRTPSVRPGDGRGGFGCEGSLDAATLGCALEPGLAKDLEWVDAAGKSVETKAYPITYQGAAPAGSGSLYFADVNGDRLADIIETAGGIGSSAFPNSGPDGSVSLWINVDGKNFVCANIPSGPNLSHPCEVGKIFDSSGQHADTGRVSFADMDADGLTDLVVVGAAGPFFFSFTRASALPLSAPLRAPRPGLLTQIRSGRGATAQMRYATIQEIEKAGAALPDSNLSTFPWTQGWSSHVPNVVPVVTGVRTLDTSTEAGSSLPLPFAFDRTVAYTYRDPVYDPWTREFRGFERVRTRNLSQQVARETTYWYSPCERGLSSSCPQTSDNDPWKVLSGRPVRVDEYVDGSLSQTSSRWSSVAVMEYGAPTVLFNGTTDGRTVSGLGATGTTTTYVYDTALGSTTSTTHTPTPDGSWDANTRDGPPSQGAARVLVRSQVMDTARPTQGNVRFSIDKGATNGAYAGKLPDVPRVTGYSRSTCVSDWYCPPTSITLSSSTTGLSERAYAYTWDAKAGVKTITGFLDARGGGTLDRRRSNGGTVSPGSPFAAAPNATVKLLERQYDPTTGTMVSEARGSALTTFQYDSTYGAFLTSQSVYTNGAGGPHLDTGFTWDFGTGHRTSTINRQNNSLVTTKYDAFGRPTQLMGPGSDGAPVVTKELSYSDVENSSARVNYVRTTSYSSQAPTFQTVAFVNGLDEPTLMMASGDITAGDTAPWIVTSFVQRDAAGRAVADVDPYFTTQDPFTAALAPPSYPTPNVYVQWDVFNRLLQTKHNGHVRDLREYHPLQVRSFDGLQAPTAGTAGAKYHGAQTDGFGRTIRTTSVGGTESVYVDTDWNLSGQPLKITQSHSGGADTVVRTFEYDTLGETIANIESNSSDKTAGTKSWRYQWDGRGHLVGTSDARGCGSDLAYDGLYRLVTENYSPCTAAQQDYTVEPEVQYVYDAYETGQSESNVETPAYETAGNAAGHLVAVYDRGAHTNYDYDFAGRVIRSSRRLALPDTSLTQANRYTLRSYDVYDEFDDASGRMVSRMAFDPSEASVFSKTVDHTVFNARGLPKSTEVLGGRHPAPVLASATYNADGSPAQLVYGDVAGTTARFGYDELQRVDLYSLSRVEPALWTTPNPKWTLPKPSDFTTQSGDLTRLLYAHDEADNPYDITDTASPNQWPAGAKPVAHQTFTYDDEYRVTKRTASFAAGTDTFVSPEAADFSRGLATPMPRQIPALAPRQTREDTSYDWRGNVKSATDDQNLTFDRSLGTVLLDSAHADRMLSAANGGVKVAYDEAGNIVNLEIVRPGPCEASKCVQRFMYEWNEVGELERARRFDYAGTTFPAGERYPATPVASPTVDVHFGYTGSTRVRKSVADETGRVLHTVELSKMLRVEGADYDAAGSDYVYEDSLISAYVNGARIAKEAAPSPTRNYFHMYLEVGDRLGSVGFVLDQETSEVVERVTYHEHGAVESDYRPARWDSYRERYKLTGKEDDYELGLTFFGARYYSPFLKRWMSADPLTVHGGAGDLNPYAYVGGRTTTMIDPSGLAAESNGDGNAPAPPPGTSCSGSDCGYDLGRVGRSIADAWDSLFGNRGPTKYGSSSPSATPTKQTVTVPRLVLSLATSYKSFVYESILRTNQGVWDIERQFGVVDMYTGLGGRDYVSDNIRWHLANDGADPNVQAAAQINATGGLAIASMMMPELFLKDLPAMLASGGRGGGGTGGGGMTTLFHGHQAPLVGGQFDLEAATEMQRAGTPEAGVYLTDDVARAATQYAGPGGFVTRTEVPTAVANAMKQASPILGPRGVVQYEWVARTPGEVNMLNQSLQTLPQIQALRAWLGNL